MTYALPVWLRRFVSVHRGIRVGETAEERVRMAMDLAARNVERGGGPFGALVTDGAGRLLGAGVNLVRQNRCSVLHAEIVALMTAQRHVGDYDLGRGGRECVLSTSVDPCAMCFGALPWSGIRRLECGATTRDAQSVGFDEGTKPGDWVEALRNRGIRTERGVLREAAAAVLARYRDIGGVVY